MDKKNTILLIVIAVATLLVAVVGATFAYYSVQVSTNKTAVNVNATAGSVGLLTLDAPVKSLYLNVTPSDMADFGKDTLYYATTIVNTEDKTISNKSNTKLNHVISKLSVSGGDTNTSYTCKAKLKISLNTSDGSMGRYLQAGDIKLYLIGSNIQKGESGSDLNETLDLHEILGNLTSETITSEEMSKEYEIVYKINGSDKNIAEIKADLELNNKTSKNVESDTNQNYLAGKSLSVTIEVISANDKLDCSIDAK